ncbi:MAG: hypothetical protein NVS3B21_22300 [Acidimicrobiales bacterium]
MTLSRRTFLAGTAASAAFALGARTSGARATARTMAPLPDPTAPDFPIKHVVVLMMENRSFDHYLGWIAAKPGFAGVDAKQGLTYLDDKGVAHTGQRLTVTQAMYQGCGFNDPDHSIEGGQLQFNNGACDGFRRGTNDDLAIGYYLEADLPLYSRFVESFTTFDRYFCPYLGPTYPNRIYQHSGQTDRESNTTTTSTLPTIWDRLSERGLKGTYYFNDAPFLAVWGSKYASISKPFSQFLSDCRAGSLPEVSYVDPKFLEEDSGTSVDDHPHADIRAGQAFINQVYDAVRTSPAWKNTVFVINYDEWGGFYDHVRPPRARDAGETPGVLKTDHGQRGFRVPCFVISPFSRPGFVSHRVYDHTSILRMIEWRWQLPALTIRDATAHNLAEVLDFGATTLAPAITLPPDYTPISPPCPPGGVSAPAPAGATADFVALKDMAIAAGWKL